MSPQRIPHSLLAFPFNSLHSFGPVPNTENKSLSGWDIHIKYKLWIKAYNLAVETISSKQQKPEKFVFFLISQL